MLSSIIRSWLICWMNRIWLQTCSRLILHWLACWLFSDIKSSISVAKHLPLFKSIKFCINQLQYSNNMFTITVLKFNLRDRPKRECNLFLRKNIFYLTIYGQQRQNGLRENVTNFARTIERTTPILWHFSKRFITRKNRRRMKKDRKKPWTSQ